VRPRSPLIPINAPRTRTCASSRRKPWSGWPRSVSLSLSQHPLKRHQPHWYISRTVCSHKCAKPAARACIASVALACAHPRDARPPVAQSAFAPARNSGTGPYRRLLNCLDNSPRPSVLYRPVVGRWLANLLARPRTENGRGPDLVFAQASTRYSNPHFR
jgi:hypothetical protein